MITEIGHYAHIGPRHLFFAQMSARWVGYALLSIFPNIDDWSDSNLSPTRSLLSLIACFVGVGVLAWQSKHSDSRISLSFFFFLEVTLKIVSQLTRSATFVNLDRSTDSPVLDTKPISQLQSSGYEHFISRYRRGFFCGGGGGIKRSDGSEFVFVGSDRTKVIFTFDLQSCWSANETFYVTQTNILLRRYLL